MQIRIMMIASLCMMIPTAAKAGVLLIPDSGSGGDKVWAFDPFDGAIISDNFIPQQGHMQQPINAVDSGNNTILVSDENADAIFEYGYDGQYIGTIADATDGLDALQGLTVFNNQIYVASRTGQNVTRFNMDGSGGSVWAAGIGTPRDLYFRSNDVLITNSDSEANGGENIEQYSHAGVDLGTWHDSDGVNGIDFPQQITQLSNGNMLVAGFSAPLGLYEYDPSGNLVNAFTNLITSPRGVHELGNGQFLYAGGSRVVRYDPVTQTEVTIINHTTQEGFDYFASFRYIEFSAAPEPSSVLLLGLAGLAVIRRRR